MPALQVTIAGVDKTSSIDWTSVSVKQVLTKSSDQFSFVIKNYGTKTYIPSLNDEVVFTNNGVRVFGGYVVQIINDPAALGKYYSIIVKDYSFALENQLITKTYSSTTVAAIITDLITNYAPAGFTTTNVVVSVSVAKVVFNYISISQCLKQLAGMIQGYEWYIDYNKDIHFFSVGTITAPFNLTDTSDNFVWDSLECITDISQIANDITIRGGKAAASGTRTEYLTGDATRTNFPLANDFAALPTITVGGVGQTVGVDGVDLDASFQWMWNQNSQLIRSTAGNTAAASANNIVVTGTPQFPLVFRKQNQASIALYGNRPKFINDKSIQNTSIASKRADAELASFAFPTGSAHFETHTDGLVVGQYININSTLRGVNTSYKIQNITTICRTPDTLTYKVELQTGGSVTMNDVLSQLLITDPAGLVDASANDTIQRISLFSENTTIVDTVSAPTTSTGPYVWGTFKWGLGKWG